MLQILPLKLENANPAWWCPYNAPLNVCPAPIIVRGWVGVDVLIPTLSFRYTLLPDFNHKVSLSINDRLPVPSVDIIWLAFPCVLGNVKVYVAFAIWGGPLIVTPWEFCSQFSLIDPEPVTEEPFIVTLSAYIVPLVFTLPFICNLELVSGLFVPIPIFVYSDPRYIFELLTCHASATVSLS